MPKPPRPKRALGQFRWVRWLAVLQMFILVMISSYSERVKLHLLVGLLVVAMNVFAAQYMLSVHRRRPLILSGPVEGILLLYAIYITGGIQSEFYIAFFISIMLAARDMPPRGGLRLLAILAPVYSAVAIAGSPAFGRPETYILTFRLSLYLLTAFYADALVKRVTHAVTEAQKSAQRVAAVNQDLDRKVQDLTLLRECSLALSSTLELNEIATILAESARRITHFDNCSLVALAADGEYWDVVYSEGMLVNIVGQRLPYSRGLTGWAAAQRQGVIVADSTVDDRINPAYRDAGLHSVIVVPLIANERCVAVLSLGNVHENHFREDHLRVLTILASQAALNMENARLYEKTRQSAITDGLTGLLNYRYFRARFEEEMRRADRYKTPVSLLMIDVDRFKRINDTYGHSQGDTVLRTLSAILRNNLRSVDIVCRTGGEEFSIILPDTDRRGAEHVARVLVEKVASHSFQSGPYQRGSRVTISVGVAVYPEEKETELVRLADNRMYRAKNSGGNQVNVDHIALQ